MGSGPFFLRTNPYPQPRNTYLAAGYTAAELRQIIMECDFNSLKDRAGEDWLPLLPRIVSILKDRGIYEGKAFLEWMSGLLEKKGVRTFGDLVRRPEAEPRYRYKLQVMVSDLTEQQVLVLPKDAHRARHRRS
jgi:NTE family protein